MHTFLSEASILGLPESASYNKIEKKEMKRVMKVALKKWSFGMYFFFKV